MGIFASTGKNKMQICKSYYKVKVIILRFEKNFKIQIIYMCNYSNQEKLRFKEKLGFCSFSIKIWEIIFTEQNDFGIDNAEYIFHIFQNYEVMEKLGQGAFAIAYRGYSKVTGQEVAIKKVL